MQWVSHLSLHLVRCLLAGGFGLPAGSGSLPCLVGALGSVSSSSRKQNLRRMQCAKLMLLSTKGCCTCSHSPMICPPALAHGACTRSGFAFGSGRCKVRVQACPVESTQCFQKSFNN